MNTPLETRKARTKIRQRNELINNNFGTAIAVTIQQGIKQKETGLQQTCQVKKEKKLYLKNEENPKAEN